MIELRGKYAGAKVFTDIVDQESISQVISLLNQPYAAGSRVRMMPDIHAGAGCTVGTTMTIGDKICPNLVGVDIGCGMETVRLKEKRIELQKLDKLIRAEIPSGFAIRSKAHRYANEIWAAATILLKQTRMTRGTSISLSTPAAAGWVWKFAITTRTRASKPCPGTAMYPSLWPGWRGTCCRITSMTWPSPSGMPT